MSIYTITLKRELLNSAGNNSEADVVGQRQRSNWFAAHGEVQAEGKAAKSTTSEGGSRQTSTLASHRSTSPEEEEVYGYNRNREEVSATTSTNGATRDKKRAREGFSDQIDRLLDCVCGKQGSKKKLARLSQQEEDDKENLETSKIGKLTHFKCGLAHESYMNRVVRYQ